MRSYLHSASPCSIRIMHDAKMTSCTVLAHKKTSTKYDRFVSDALQRSNINIFRLSAILMRPWRPYRGFHRDAVFILSSIGRQAKTEQPNTEPAHVPCGQSQSGTKWAAVLGTEASSAWSFIRGSTLLH